MNNGVEIDHFKPVDIKMALLREGYLEHRCYNCDFKEERVVDRKMPILMNFRDKNKRNYTLENIEMLCYNCYYLFVADVFDEKQVIQIEDYFETCHPADKVDWEISEEYIEQIRKTEQENKDNDGSEYISRI